MEKRFEQEIKTFSQLLGEPDFLLNKKLQAYRRLQKDPTTVFRHGLNIVTSFEVDYENLKLFQPAKFEISSSKAYAVNLSDCYKDKNFARNLLQHFEIDNRLLAMNVAFLNSGVMIRFPKNTDVGSIHLKLKATGDDFSHILIIAAEGSKGTIIDDISGESNYRSVGVEIVAEKNAAVRFGSIQRLNSCKNYMYKKSVVGQDASVEWLDVTTGGSISKTEIYSDLKGQGSKSSMFNVFFGHNEQQFDFLTKCTHIGRNTESLMLTSGALQEKSKAIHQGFAKIQDKAYAASAHQKAKILLLSENARASPIPKLEIDNNDVTATHEASVGQIDSEKVFYMMTRGLSEKESKKLYVEGFFEQYISRIDVEEIRTDVDAIVAERMTR